MLCMKFAATQTLIVKRNILVRHPNHNRIVLNNTVDLVTMEICQQSLTKNLSGHQIHVNVVTILDREENGFEHDVREAVWVKTKNLSLNSNSYTRITPSHSLDHSINTLCRFSPHPNIP